MIRLFTIFFLFSGHQFASSKTETTSVLQERRAWTRYLPSSFFLWFCSLCTATLVGGGGEGGEQSASETSSKSSASSDAESVSNVIYTLKKRKKELKNELSDVRKQIKYLESLERKKKKKKNEPRQKEAEREKTMVKDEKVTVTSDFQHENVGNREETVLLEMSPRSLEHCEVVVVDNYEEAEFLALNTGIIGAQEEGPSLELASEKDAKQDFTRDFGRIKLGQTFKSFNEFSTIFDSFCAATYTNVRKGKTWKNKKGKLANVDGFPYLRVEYHCVHYGLEGKPRTKDGSRPNQTYSALGCKYELHVALNARKCQYQIKKFENSHCGHRQDKESYESYRKNRKLTEDEQELYINKYLVDLKVPVQKVREEISKNTGKKPTTHNLRRYVQSKKNREGGQSDMEVLLTFLEKMKEEDEDSSIQIAYADSNEQDFAMPGKKIIKVIFIQSGRMRKLVKKYGKVVMVDGTYNLSNRQYVLMPFHIIDHNYRTRVCAFSLVSNETQSVMKVAMEFFAQENPLVDLEFMVVDKDFMEIEATASSFPNVRFVICQWHSIRRVDEVIHKIPLPPNKQYIKKELRGLFREMVNGETEEIYFGAWQEIVSLNQRHVELTKFVQYLDTNWNSHKELFARCYLQKCSLFRTFTNNRAENFNKQLKATIKKQSPVNEVVKQALNLASRQEADSVLLDVKSTESTLVPTDTRDPYVMRVMHEGRGLLSHEILKKLREECDKAKDVPQAMLKKECGQLVCSLLAGPCHFSESYNLPCRHLLATRKANDEALLEKDMISKHWLIEAVSDPVPVKEKESSKSEKSNIYVKRNETARKAKHADTSKTLKEMASVLSHYPEKERSEFMKQLEMLISAWNNGLKTKLEDDLLKLLSPQKKGKQNKDTDTINSKDFIFSPKKETQGYKTSEMTTDKKTKGKKRLFPDSGKQASQKRGKHDLEDWQAKIVKMYKEEYQAFKHWGREEFDILTDVSKTGPGAYFNDTMFHYVMLLMKKQFPHVQGLQDTVDYKSSGMERTDPRLPIIQPAHSGGMHWTLLSNMILTEEDRKRQKICLYDSMIHLRKESDFQQEIPSAIEWQACQILCKEKHEDSEAIDIIGMPCEQQKNSQDCGLHVVQNMVTLAMGLDPSTIIYEQNGRGQLMDMISKCELRMFDHRKFDPAGPDRGCFTVFSRTRVHKKVLLTKNTTTVLPICFCQQTESWDNIVFCAKCSGMYHQKCHLMGTNTTGKSIADSLDCFLCFKCREPGKYSKGFGNVPEPNQDCIDRIVETINKLPFHKLCGHYLKLVCKTKQVPVTLTDYQTVQSLLAKYDLNALNSKSSRLLVAVKNFYNRHCSLLPKHRPFEEFTIADITLFTLSLICDIEDEDCPPIWSKQPAILLGEDLAEVYKLNKTWIATLNSHLNDLQKTAKKLKLQNPENPEARHLVSHLINELREAHQRVEALSQTLNDSADGKATKLLQEWKLDAVGQCEMFKIKLDALSFEVETFLGGKVL